MSLTQAAIVAGALIALTLIGGYLFFRAPAPERGQQDFGTQFGMVLKDYDGKEVHLYEFRRQVLIAYVWASWCTYCGDEMKRLATLKKEYGDKVQIVAVNRAEPINDAKGFTDKLDVAKDMTLLLDPNDTFFKSIGGYAMPETVFIDPSGVVVYHQRGPLDLTTLQARIKELVH